MDGDCIDNAFCNDDKECECKAGFQNVTDVDPEGVCTGESMSCCGGGR